MKNKNTTSNNKNISRAVKIGILGALLGTTMYYNKKIKYNDKLNMNYNKLNNTVINNLDEYSVKEVLEKDIVLKQKELDVCQKELFKLEDIEDEYIKKWDNILKVKTNIKIALSKQLKTTLDDYYKRNKNIQKGGTYGQLHLERELFSTEKQHLLDDLNYIKINLRKCLVEKENIKKRYIIILDEIIKNIKIQESQSRLYENKIKQYSKK